MLKKLLESLSKTNLEPLQHRLRPKSLDDYIGHTQHRGDKKILETILESSFIPPIFLLGPPGVGKTSFARMIGKKEGYRYTEVNAMRKGFDVVQSEVDEAIRIFKTSGIRTILFLDEIDNVKPDDQKILLPHIAKGGPITLLAATPRDPRKILDPELLKKFVFLPLRKHGEEDLRTILDRALKDKERGLGKRKIIIDEASKLHLIRASEGNARSLLTLLSWAVTNLMLKNLNQKHPNKPGGTFVIDQPLIDVVHERLKTAKEERRKKRLAQPQKNN